VACHQTYHRDITEANSILAEFSDSGVQEIPIDDFVLQELVYLLS